MPKQPITRYTVDELVQCRKVAARTRSDGRKESLPLCIELRKADSPNIDIGLIFEVRTPRKALPGVPSVQRPSASLLSAGERIRGIDWTIKHEVTHNGVPTGVSVKGWHEHYWTDEDGSSSIREPNPLPKNQDVSALIEWCCKQWNIEGIEESMRLFDDHE
jgi:hypothetical protein